MKMEKIIELLSYTLPAIVTGAVAYYFFLMHTKGEEKKLKYALLKSNQKQALPLKLQAYERITLFLERINPSSLLIRVTSINNDKIAYAQSLISTIEQEFEHNLTQQIYMSEKCWSVVVASKNATIHIVKKAAENTDVKTAQDLREYVLKAILNSSSPSTAALSFIKEEISEII